MRERKKGDAIWDSRLRDAVTLVDGSRAKNANRRDPMRERDVRQRKRHKTVNESEWERKRGRHSYKTKLHYESQCFDTRVYIQ